MKLTLHLLPLLCLLAATAPADAQNITWTGAIDSDWNTAGNWNPAIVPGPGTSAFVHVQLNEPEISGGLDCGDLTIYGSATVTVTSGGLHVLGKLDVSGNLIVQPGAGELRLSGDLKVTQDAPGITNSTTTIMDGVGSTWVPTLTLPPVEVVSGVRTFENTNVESLRMSGGEIEFIGILFVEGDVDLTGGQLSWDTSAGLLTGFDVEGNFNEANVTIGATTDKARILCKGNWSSTSSFVLPSGIIEFDGGTSATIGGPSPTFQNVEIHDAGSVKTLVSDIAVLGTLKVRNSTTFDLAAHTVTASGSWHSYEGAISVLGSPGLIVFNGAGELRTGAFLLPPIRIDGAALELNSSTLSSIEMTAGTLNIQSGKVPVVVGDVDLLGGTLGWLDSDGLLEVLDVEGDFTVTGAVVGATNGESRIYCAGNWSSPSTFVMPSGIVELDGGTAATLGGPSPTFTKLEIQDAGSVKTLTSDLAVLESMKVQNGSTLDLATHTVKASGTWESYDGGASVLGAPGLVVFDGIGTLRTGTKLLPPIRIDGASLEINASLLSSIEMTAGTLNIQSGKTVSVVGNVDLLGGTFGWLDSDAFLETLDVEGNFTASGASLGTSGSETRLYVAGDWTSDAGFSLTQGLVRFDGSGTTLVSGATPGEIITLPTLELWNGTRVIGNDLTLAPTSLEIKSGAGLDVAGNRMTIPGTVVTVKGDLMVGPGGELQLASTVSMTVTSSGDLRVIGDPGNLAAVTGHLGGGYALEIDGTLAARNFVFQEMGPAGINIDGAVAAAPDDLRGGVFDLAAPGGVLLDLALGVGHTFWYTTFLDSTGTAANNVRRTSGAAVSFANWGGAFAGEDFDDDPSDLIDWLPPATTEIASFTAASGPEKVFVEWQTTAEVDVEAFVLQSGPSAAGPFATVAEVLPTGPGAYALTHEPLLEDVQVFYQLQERVSTDALNLLGQASATPWDADLPQAFKTVGPTGQYATIQEAVNASGAPFSVVYVEAGTYDSFSIDAPSGNVHVIPDGSGPVVIDTTLGSLEIRNTLPGQTVQLVDLVINGNVAGPSLLIQDTLGTVILDQLEVHGGLGQPGIRSLSAAVIALQRSLVDGAPGLEATASKIYASRGAVDEADLNVGSTLKTTQLAPLVTLDPTSVHVSFAGVMPDISAPPFAALGQTTTLDIETEPGGIWLLAVSPDYGYLDLPLPGLWQMAAFLNVLAFSELGSGATDPVTGLDTFALPIPPEGQLMGHEFVFQLMHIAAGAPLLRPSNVLTLFAVPE